MVTAPFRPSRGVTVEIPYRSLVLRADPEFEYKNRHQLFYEFSNGREFREDENQHGAYLPSGPASVALSGLVAAGNAGILLRMPLQIMGVGSVGTAMHVTAVASLPIGPISVALGGVGASGNAGFVLQTVGLLTGVGSVGAATHVTGIGAEDDVPMRGVSATGTANNIMFGGRDDVPLRGVSATGSAGSITAFALTVLPDLDNVPIGAAFSEITTDLTGDLIYSFTPGGNPNNLFSLNGNLIQVAGLLSVTNYTIGVQVTNSALTETATLTVDCTSVADSWIPGVRPFLPTSPSNILIGSGRTYTPIAWPDPTEANFFPGMKFYFDIPDPDETNVVSILGQASWGNVQAVIPLVMTPGFGGINQILGNGDLDNEAVSFSGTRTINFYNLNVSGHEGSASDYANGDIITNTPFGSLTGGAFGGLLGAGIVASGANLMMALTKEEFTQQGGWNRWIPFQSKNVDTIPGFVAPAINGDGSNPSGILQTGQLFAIPPGTPMPPGLSIYGQAMFTAMMNYGAWPWDTGGSYGPYLARWYKNVGGSANPPWAASTSWTDADVGLMIPDIALLWPLLQLVS